MPDSAITNVELVVGTIVVLFAAITIMLEAGRWMGLRDRSRDSRAEKGLGPMEGAMFGLMGLLIAFTFSGAARRFDLHRDLILKETNAIGTAYMRIDLLPSECQEGLRQSFQQYLEARLAFYRNLGVSSATTQQAAERARHLQVEIWRQGVEATRRLNAETNATAVTSLVMQSFNDMIDITTDRMMAQQTHPPVEVYWMMGVLVLVCSMLAGYEIAFRRTRSWLHQIGFAAILAATLFVIIDFEYPRMGLIRVDIADQFLVDLLAEMRR